MTKMIVRKISRWYPTEEIDEKYEFKMLKCNKHGFRMTFEDPNDITKKRVTIFFRGLEQALILSLRRRVQELNEYERQYKEFFTEWSFFLKKSKPREDTRLLTYYIKTPLVVVEVTSHPPRIKLKSLMV